MKTIHRTKRTYRVMAVLLAVVMVFSALSISAAALYKEQTEYSEYTFFGDSVTAAYGIPDYFVVKEKNGTAEGYRVKNSYADLVAAGVGIEGEERYHNEAHSGWRTSEVREVVDPSYDNDDGAAARGIAAVFGAQGSQNTLEENRTRIIAELKRSDLITLDIGSNDLQLPLVLSLFSVLNPTASEDYTAWAIEDLLNRYGNANEVINVLAQGVALAHGVEFAIRTISEAALTGLYKVQQNYPIMMRKIHEINPDATIVGIGFYNPFSQARISPNIPISIGKVIDPVIQSMNLYISQLCPAKNLYTYVDAFKVSTIGTLSLTDFLGGEDGSLINMSAANNFMLYIHPDEAGHAYIAEQVLKALPEHHIKHDRIVKKNPADKNWYLYDNDKIDYTAQGIYKNQNGWWKTTNGLVTFDETGVFKNEYGWWRVVDSKVDFNANGIYKNKYGWWKTTNGRVTFRESGLFKNENGWWRVVDSKVDFDFTGVQSNQNGTWYLEKGKVNFQKNGKVKVDGETFQVKNGRVIG
ncbi:MAG: hypothetical protein IJ230_08390 [Clostridia bacterium]|nr:hypothetical protein [Clostridia bacterium]